MIEKYFQEYEISEQELKERIYLTLDLLSQYQPDTWQREWLEYADPDRTSEEIIPALSSYVPLITDLGLEIAAFTVEENLRIIAISLDGVLDSIRLDYILPDLLFRLCQPYFLEIRYAMATEVLTTKLGLELRYDRTAIGKYLSEEAWVGKNITDVLFATKAAHEEINRLFETPEGTKYAHIIMTLEDKMEEYIQENYVVGLAQAFIKVCQEGLMKNVDIINSQLDFKAKFTAKEVKNWLEETEKTTLQMAHTRLGIISTWGGKRERQRFTWTDDRKLSFFNEVEAIPKVSIKEKSKQKEINIWENLYYQFERGGEEAVKILSDVGPYHTVPKDLLAEALQKWNYYEKNFKKIKNEDRPRMFLYRQVLRKLRFPETYHKERDNRDIAYKLSTLDKHYKNGKILDEKIEQSRLT